MKQFLILLCVLFAVYTPALSTDIDIGAVSSIPGFNTANAGVDTALSGVTVTLGSPNVTCSSCLPTGAVGIGGMQVTLAGVRYTIASVGSRSAFVLTVNYTASSGTVSGTLHKFVHLRIYALSTFTPFGSSTVVQAGAPGTTAWFRRYGVSIVNDGSQNIAHFPQINDLPATTDSSNPTARYFAALHTQAGGFIQSYPGCVDEFRLSHETTPTSWAQICTFNSPPNPAPTQPTNFLTEQQINARFPSCLVNNLDFFAATGNVKSCLTLSSDFSITGATLSITSALTRIQEEGSNLVQRPTLNFVGTSFTAADDAGNTRTNVTADSDLDALASNSTNGFWARTGAGTGAARTITGTTNRIGVTNGDGVAGNPTLDIGSDVVTLTGTQTLTNKTLTSPRVGTAILDTNGNPYVTVTPTGSAVNGFTWTNNTAGNGPTLGVQDQSGTNTAGVPLDLAGGKGTGNAVPGQVAVRYPLIGASGTTLQSLSTNRFPVSTSPYTNTAIGTAIANTTTETSLFTGSTPTSGSTRIIEAGSARAGTMYRLRVYGIFQTTGTPTIRFKIKFGSVVVADSDAFTSPNNAAGLVFMDAYMYVNAVGSSGLVRVDFEGRVTTNLGGATTPTFFLAAAGEPTVDFTANQTIEVTAQWGTAAAGNSVQLLSASIQRIR